MLPPSSLLWRLPLLFKGMASRKPSTGWVPRGDLGRAPDQASQTSLRWVRGCGAFPGSPRERFPKPNLVWPSSAAVQPALLKGDRWPGQLGVGSPRVLGMRENQAVLEGRKVRPVERGLHRPQGQRIASTHPAPNPALECQPAPWAPGGGPRLLPTCFSLRRLRAQAGPRGQKRGQSPAGSANARATLNERGGRSRAAGGCRRGERQKFGAQ